MEEVETKKFLTAKEAKELADKSNYLMNQLYKRIKEEAKENRTSMYWDISHMSAQAVVGAMIDLKDNGYRVEQENNGDVLYISWR